MSGSCTKVALTLPPGYPRYTYWSGVSKGLDCKDPSACTQHISTHSEHVHPRMCTPAYLFLWHAGPTCCNVNTCNQEDSLPAVVRHCHELQAARHVICLFKSYTWSPGLPSTALIAMHPWRPCRPETHIALMKTILRYAHSHCQSACQAGHVLLAPRPTTHGLSTGHCITAFWPVSVHMHYHCAVVWCPRSSGDSLHADSSTVS